MGGSLYGSSNGSLEILSFEEDATRERLIVAIDFGTTFSGVAFCHSSGATEEDIQVISTWSASNGIKPKTPTEIRYPDKGDPAWGADATVANVRRGNANAATVYSRFKLLLDPNVGTSVYGATADNSSNTSINGRGCTDVDSYQRNPNAYIRLPAGKTALDVSTDYLRMMYKSLMETFLRKQLPTTLDLTPIQFVFTVPAIWGHGAQEATRKAALDAGFCSRPDDVMTMVSEPEAAAMFVLSSMSSSKNFSQNAAGSLSSLNKGDSFVICDAGGGTVDLISYTVAETSPALSLREAAVGTGAKCGSSYIDEAFLGLLRKKIGSSFDDAKKWSQKEIGRGSALMNEFDKIKRSFGVSTTETWWLALPVSVPDDEDNGITDDELELTSSDMRDLFDTVVGKIIKLVEQQVDAVRSKQPNANLSTVFLVGGFGESQHLYMKLSEWGSQQQPPLTIVNPTKSWSAIMRGAILYTLKPAVQARQLRQHYGLEMDLPYDSELHKGTTAYTCPFGGLWAEDCVNWTAKLGDSCESDEPISFSVYYVIYDDWDNTKPNETKIYGSQASTQPVFITDSAVYTIGTLSADFSSVKLSDLASTYDTSNGKMAYQLDFVIKMKLSSGEATFTVWLKEKMIGSARITDSAGIEG